MRSLASRLQFDLAEGSDGGEQNDYGDCFCFFFLSFASILKVLQLKFVLTNVHSGENI